MPTGFDLLAPLYDLVPWIPVHPDEVRQELEGLETILDLGGGTGRFTRRFAPGALVVDVSRGMLKRARRPDRGLNAVHGTGRALPLRDHSVDGVVITEAYHHFAPHQVECLKEARRVLRPGGRLVIEEIDPRTRAGRYVQWLENTLGMDSIFLTPERLDAHVHAAGFEKATWRRTGRMSYLLTAERT